MDYAIIVAATLAGFHALTFARWLKQQGNTTGAYGVFFISFICVAIPVYRVIMRD